MTDLKSNKFIILIISVIVIISFDALYSISSILLNFQHILNFDKFEYSVFEKIVTNVFLLTVSILSIKISCKEVNSNQIFQLDKKLLLYLPLAISVGILANIFGAFVLDSFTSAFDDFGHGEKVSTTLSYLDTNFKKIVYVFLVGVFVPIIEEIYMRLYAYNILRGKFNVIVAIILSTIIFLAFHINLSLFPFIIIANIVLCLSYEYTKNLIIPILIHITINIYSLI